jgi:hypothetical protein
MQVSNFAGNLKIRIEIKLFEFLIFRQDIPVVVNYTYTQKRNWDYILYTTLLYM